MQISYVFCKTNFFRALVSETCFFDRGVMRVLGARLRGRTAPQRSKKGSEKVLGRVLRKGSQKGS